MKEFISRLMNTEFLPMSEVRKIKVTLVMALLLIITSLTIPFSFFLDYTFRMKLAVLISLAVIYGIIVVMIHFNRIYASIQVSIMYAIAVTIFYTVGTTSFYAYLFIYISLTILIFYQELFSYLVYGLALLGYGIYYTITHVDQLAPTEVMPGALYVYIAVLVVFYLIFLLQIIYNEKLYTDLNYDWVRLNHIIEHYQETILTYDDRDRREEHEPLIYENLSFQKATDEISVFIAEQYQKHGSDIVHVLDLFTYIHERGLDNILENEEISTAMKKVAHRLDKYLLNRRTDMYSIVLNFYSEFVDTEDYRENRYTYKLNDLFASQVERLIGLTMLYQYLVNEPTRKDRWEQIGRVIDEETLDAFFSSDKMHEFLTSEQRRFYQENKTLFEKFLIHNGDGEERL